MQIKLLSAGRVKQPASNTARLIVAASILLLAGNVLLAQVLETSSIYEIAVPFDAAENNAHENAYRLAFAQVLVKVTGKPLADVNLLMADLFPLPGRFVAQFRTGPEDTLIVTLDGPAIEKILRQSRQTVWGGDRPVTLMWLAVDWGQGERQIVAADEAQRSADEFRSIDRNRLLRERVQEIAQQRGIPVVFPLLDMEDRQNLSFGDIWGGFDQSVLSASERYAVSSVLVGRIRPDTLQPYRWTWYLDGRRQDWNGVTEESINLLADSLAAQYAVQGDAAVDIVRLTVTGINSMTAYGEVQRFLENLSAIDELRVHTVDGHKIVYEVAVQGGTERLSRALAQSNLLQQSDVFTRINGRNASAYESDRASLEFTYRSN